MLRRSMVTKAHIQIQYKEESEIWGRGEFSSTWLEGQGAKAGLQWRPKNLEGLGRSNVSGQTIPEPRGKAPKAQFPLVFSLVLGKLSNSWLADFSALVGISKSKDWAR